MSSLYLSSAESPLAPTLKHQILQNKQVYTFSFQFFWTQLGTVGLTFLTLTQTVVASVYARGLINTCTTEAGCYLYTVTSK